MTLTGFSLIMFGVWMAVVAGIVGANIIRALKEIENKLDEAVSAIHGQTADARYRN